jgi:hypothetical protein
MPCRDYESEKIITKDTQHERDNLAALLCLACTTLLEGTSTPPELLDWYEKHREADLENMRELLQFAALNTTILSKADFDTLDTVLTDLRNRYS